MSLLAKGVDFLHPSHLLHSVSSNSAAEKASITGLGGSSSNYYLLLIHTVPNTTSLVEDCIDFTFKWKTNMERKKIKKNCIKCNYCGDIIESKHVHDFVFCKCGKVAVDGGHEYLKRMYQKDPKEDFEELSEFE